MLRHGSGPHPRTGRRNAAARRVRDLLRSAIVHGEFRAGTLPSEPSLMLSFSTSRQVIRDALALLRDEGLVRRAQGAGTLSTATGVRHDFDFLHGPAGVDVDISHEVLSVNQEAASPQVAQRLQIDVGVDCGVVELLTSLDGEPFYTATTYVPASFVPMIAQFGPRTEWFALYERAGIHLGTTDHSIEAVVADDLVAQLLDVRVGHPLLLFERLVRDTTGTPVEYTFTRVRGDRLTLMQHLTRPTTLDP